MTIKSLAERCPSGYWYDLDKKATFAYLEAGSMLRVEFADRPMRDPGRVTCLGPFPYDTDIQLPNKIGDKFRVRIRAWKTPNELWN